jgi:hypothetical protein
MEGVDDMEQEEQQPRSRLFTIRLWQEELGAGHAEWRGRVQDISTGTAAYFRDWPGLIAVLSRMVETADASNGDPPGQLPARPDENRDRPGS